jgi:hypothetical protein
MLWMPGAPRSIAATVAAAASSMCTTDQTSALLPTMELAVPDYL